MMHLYQAWAYDWCDAQGVASDPPALSRWGKSIGQLMAVAKAMNPEITPEQVTEEDKEMATEATEEVKEKAAEQMMLFNEKLLDFRKRQLKRALEPLKLALESYRYALEGLESALIEFEEDHKEPEQRPERPQAIEHAGKGGGLDLLSFNDLCQELRKSKSWVYKRVQSGEIRSVKLGHNIKVRREDLEGYLEERSPLHNA